jgi:hypothetical protein
MPHFNQLTPDELERLALLSEELGEAQHIIGKILRHGYDSSNPLETMPVRNRELLEHELGHVEFAISLLTKTDLSRESMDTSFLQKQSKIDRWLHHNIVKSTQASDGFSYRDVPVREEQA